MTTKSIKYNIFLVGFMASGKSSLGKKIAKKLNWKFIDLDQEIESLEGISINQIFELKGEIYFRKLETKVLKTIIKFNEKNTVVSLGGGTFCTEKNISLVHRNGISFYLKLDIQKIIGRLKADKENRPLVKDLEEKELQKKVKQLFEEREPFYNQAHYSIAAEKSKSKLVKEVLILIEHQK